MKRRRGSKPTAIRVVWRLLLATAAALSVVAGAMAAPPASTDVLAHAKQIGVEVDARYPGLRVSETSSTAVIESLTLFDDPANPREVLADNGIYFGVCPNGATCPFPDRAPRPPEALAPRRVALELAVRTFLETTTDLVVVSLPTRRFILLVFERDAIDSRGVSDALAPYPTVASSWRLRSLVDANTLPHLYAPFALTPTPSGRDSLLAWPLFSYTLPFRDARNLLNRLALKSGRTSTGTGFLGTPLGRDSATKPDLERAEERDLHTARKHKLQGDCDVIPGLVQLIGSSEEGTDGCLADDQA
jgi:hypothetical protein